MNTTTRKRSIRLPALLTAIAALVGLALLATSPASAAFAAANKPTVVLVHGAFADASGWNSVIERLSRKGYATVAVANPLRGVKEDAAALEARLATIDGPIVLVGHSYGGTVLSNVRAGNSNIQSLVFIAAFAPAKGEAAAELAGMYPGSTLGDTLAPVALPDGSNDLYIKPELFHKQFAADVPARRAALMAATQR
ncbi:MAG TPA: alpha/beta fold hydrolase, partial [Tepidisphaeraceae bacterium]|nr:alpha/beta fold hydrolase [Tepidisphaeraceae bacterium]